MDKLKAGVVGCGVISDIYLQNLTTRFKTVEAVACADVFEEKSKERAAQYGIRTLSVDALLADPEIDVVLNLTNPQFHAGVSLAAINSGKHVYSEKPLSVSFPDAKKIMDTAASKGVRVGCAPDTFLGAGLQTCFKVIEDGWIGRPLSAVAFFTCRGHERWHINPDFYYKAGGGPCLDMGPYYITALVAALGSVKRVSAVGSRGFEKRTIGTGPRKGESFPVEIDTHMSASLEFKCGAVATVMLSFDIWQTHLPNLEIYGSDGSLSLPDPNTFDGPVYLRRKGEGDFKELPLFYSHAGNQRGLGLAQMCGAILHGGEHRASGALALHVLEVLDAMDKSAKSGQTVLLETECKKPAALETNIWEG